mgnify:CR=1 FL=1
MKVYKSIDQMLEEIEFQQFGEYQIIQGEGIDGENIVNAVDAICTAHPFLNKYSSLLMEESIDNAIRRGNNGDPFVIASAKVLLGKKGWVLRIRDSGKGFDFDRVLKNSEYQNRGSGLFILKNERELQFNYENNGNTLNVMGFYVPQTQFSKYPFFSISYITNQNLYLLFSKKFQQHG